MGGSKRIRKVKRIAVIEADVDGLFTMSQRQSNNLHVSPRSILTI